MSAAKVLFMGTPDFAVPVLESLAAAGYDVVAVITQPDKPVGRRRTLTPPPVKTAAQRLGLPVLQPAKVRDEAVLEELMALGPDVAVTAAYGQLLPQRLLDIPRLGCLNVHASLLPRWRGAAPIHRALMQGDGETGVAIMKTVLELDAGPVLGMKRIPILENDNVGTLHDKLAELGTELLVSLLPDYLAGAAVLRDQNEIGLTYAKRILPEDEVIDWQRLRQHVHNHVRGLCPWPGAKSYLNGQVFKVWETGIRHEGLGDDETTGNRYEPGTVYSSQGGVFVQCADGPLQLHRVQPAGKKAMMATEWYRGVQGQVRLGAQE